MAAAKAVAVAECEGGIPLSKGSRNSVSIRSKIAKIYYYQVRQGNKALAVYLLDLFEKEMFPTLIMASN